MRHQQTRRFEHFVSPLAPKSFKFLFVDGVPIASNLLAKNFDREARVISHCWI